MREMRSDYILLDTNIISHARKVEPPEPIREFLRGLRRGSVAISTATVFEVHRGALLKMKLDEVQGQEIMAWLEAFLQTDIYLLPNNVAVERLISEMSVCGPLVNFWVSDGKAAKAKFGSDARIAATAIVHEIPIATCNVRDFMCIHDHFPIPGIYDPMTRIWHVDPPVGWFVDDAANDDRPSSAAVISAFDVFRR